MTDPRYPVGRFERPQTYSPEQRSAWLEEIAELPARLAASVDGLNDQQLDTPYRDGGWTVRQVVHHVVDSHIHSYVRCKFAITMDNPIIMPYDEEKWAALDDASHADPAISLALLTNLHTRWVRFFRSLDDAAFARTLVHPENGPMTLDLVVALYAWHGRHHLAHITELRRRMNW